MVCLLCSVCLFVLCLDCVRACTGQLAQQFQPWCHSSLQPKRRLGGQHVSSRQISLARMRAQAGERMLACTVTKCYGCLPLSLACAHACRVDAKRSELHAEMERADAEERAAAVRQWKSKRESMHAGRLEVPGGGFVHLTCKSM